MAAILKSKMVVSGNNIVRLYIFMTICIWQFPCTFCYIDLSSFFLKMAKKAWKYHKLQSSANNFPQIRFMGIFNMLFVIPFCIKLHQKSFDINFFRVQPFSYQPMTGRQQAKLSHLKINHLPLAVTVSTSGLRSSTCLLDVLKIKSSCNLTKVQEQD